MPPHLHPRSRSTLGLFTGTLIASLVVVGLPHVFPCPSPRRTFADSEMIMTADGQHISRVRRRRRRDIETETEPETETARPDQPSPAPVEDEVSTFFQMEAEAKRLAQLNHQCPVPKPRGIIGELLGFHTSSDTEHTQASDERR
ncbi:alpha-1-3-mannosyltransferase [Penicillium chermesinum]|uniref:Alpha-1-3-mannosyltransferase n=1 Tax=Penicillium chermesinum TaxID=63820 RepID=A0A9W9PG38_9EURO|nr:alpha-1-3-mannosyltransferase [Penicillium chermesinum]KAJ5246214.1 alpha-1-3-mannosyltransferase [Penicillium chermesinum]KAJ6144501.1 alpha-1-3-mannosyltransferase [Penicillium chermesinum]